MSANERDDRPRRDPSIEEKHPAPAAPVREERAPDRTVPDRTVPDRTVPDRPAPERTRRPAPGIEHEPEPDGENLIPAKDRPGTL